VLARSESWEFSLCRIPLHSYLKIKEVPKSINLPQAYMICLGSLNAERAQGAPF